MNSLTPDTQVTDDLVRERFDSLTQSSGSGVSYLLRSMSVEERFADITITPGLSPGVAGVEMTRRTPATDLCVRGKAVTSLVYPNCLTLSALVMTLVMTSNTTLR